MTWSILDVLTLLTVLLTLIGSLMYFHARSNAQARISARLRAERTSIRQRGSAAGVQGDATAGLLGVASRVLSAVGRAMPLFDVAQRTEMAAKLVMAGYRQPGALPVLIGVAVGCGLFTGLLSVSVVWPRLPEGGGMMVRIGVLVLAGYIGMMLPRIVLDRLVNRRQKAIERSFPDALDLMVVCTNSGLGLNACLMRVAHELAFLAPALSDELRLTATELQLSGDTAVVLRRLAERIGLPSVRGLVSTLIQSRQFGTPIGDALRVLSRSERTARLMRTEEAAAKLATKITLPMMLFILPTVLIVAGAPSVMRLMEFFAK
ncbi:type II secretion system F family protein [Pusillimonas sp. TS35]|uniref:type II secretion system F family protein n=1 Tax=Paracandidimonas lactea TaxID=2895524 RepID=UPI00136D9F3D|nr:type II secretion system F family protein [Paracandidimonas lactea]MYN13507.1 type II secretion system F family protein [Pusillimonas sp. TS35]